MCRKQLKDFLGDNDLAEEVIRESLKDEVQARTFLEDVGRTFPQVLTSVKTRQVAFHVLREVRHFLGRDIRKTQRQMGRW
jgi:hypothetical protein